MWGFFAYFVHNSAGDTHAVENSHIDNGGHSSIVDGLRAIRPHVWALCQVDVAGRKTARTKAQIIMTLNRKVEMQKQGYTRTSY